MASLITSCMSKKFRSKAGTGVGLEDLGPMLRELLAATARGATKVKQLSPKRGPRNYYKGKGAASVGHHTKKGEIQSAKTFSLVNL